MSDAQATDPLDRLLNPSGVSTHISVLPVLGVPVRFESSSALIIAAIETEYEHWRRVTTPDLVHASPQAIVRIDLSDTNTSALYQAVVPLISPRWVAADRIRIETADIIAVSDWTRHQAAALISPALLHDRDRFRYGLLDTLTLFVLGRMDRQPLHAAAIGNGEAALLLTGASGTGKSTLAYAAIRAGLDALSDDAVYLQLDPVLRVWSMRGALHLVPSAVSHFPELGASVPVVRANGKAKITVARPVDAAPPFVGRVGICLLTRDATPALPERLSPDEAVRELTATLDPGFDRFAETIGTAIRRISEGGAWRLAVTGTPATMIAQLSTLLAQVTPR